MIQKLKKMNKWKLLVLSVFSLFLISVIFKGAFFAKSSEPISASDKSTVEQLIKLEYANENLEIMVLPRLISIPHKDGSSKAAFVHFSSEKMTGKAIIDLDAGKIVSKSESIDWARHSFFHRHGYKPPHKGKNDSPFLIFNGIFAIIVLSVLYLLYKDHYSCGYKENEEKIEKLEENQPGEDNED